MPGRHGGYAAQAKRRGEAFLQCATCGGPIHPRAPYRHYTPTFWENVRILWSVLGQAFAYLVILGGIVGGLYLWARAVMG